MKTYDAHHPIPQPASGPVRRVRAHRLGAHPAHRRPRMHLYRLLPRAHVVAGAGRGVRGGASHGESPRFGATAPEGRSVNIAIIGSRDYPDLARVRWHVTWLAESDPQTAIISGSARGVDATAAQAARERGLAVREFPADWERHGKRAGYLRNQDIIAAADWVLAFWDGSSPGTRHALDLAQSHRKPYRVYGPGGTVTEASNGLPIWRYRDALEGTLAFCQAMRTSYQRRLDYCRAMQSSGGYSTAIQADATRDNADLRQADQNRQQLFWETEVLDATACVADMDAIIADKIAHGAPVLDDGQQMQMFAAEGGVA
jgi:hypothetical protein